MHTCFSSSKMALGTLARWISQPIQLNVWLAGRSTGGSLPRPGTAELMPIAAAADALLRSREPTNRLPSCNRHDMSNKISNAWSHPQQALQISSSRAPGATLTRLCALETSKENRTTPFSHASIRKLKHLEGSAIQCAQQSCRALWHWTPCCPLLHGEHCPLFFAGSTCCSVVLESTLQIPLGGCQP